MDALNTAGKESGLSFTLAERRTAPQRRLKSLRSNRQPLLEQAQHMMLESDNAPGRGVRPLPAIAAGKEGSGEAAQRPYARHSWMPA